MMFVEKTKNKRSKRPGLAIFKKTSVSPFCIFHNILIAFKRQNMLTILMTMDLVFVKLVKTARWAVVVVKWSA